jgi:hypothetical protein
MSAFSSFFQDFKEQFTNPAVHQSVDKRPERDPSFGFQEPKEARRNFYSY